MTSYFPISTTISIPYSINSCNGFLPVKELLQELVKEFINELL